MEQTNKERLQNRIIRPNIVIHRSEESSEKKEDSYSKDNIRIYDREQTIGDIEVLDLQPSPVLRIAPSLQESEGIRNNRMTLEPSAPGIIWGLCSRVLEPSDNVEGQQQIEEMIKDLGAQNQQKEEIKNSQRQKSPVQTKKELKAPRSAKDSGQDSESRSLSQSRTRPDKNAKKVVFTPLKQILQKSELLDDYDIDMRDYLTKYGSPAYGHRNLLDFEIVLWYVQWKYKQQQYKYTQFIEFLKHHRDIIDKHGEESYQNEHQSDQLKAYMDCVNKFYSALKLEKPTEGERLKRLYGARAPSSSALAKLETMKKTSFPSLYDLEQQYKKSQKKH